MFNFSDRFQELRSTIIGLVLLLASIVMGVVWIGIGLSRWLSACLGDIWGPIVLGLICFVPVIMFALMKAFGRSTPKLPANNTATAYGEPAAAQMAGLFEKLSGHSPFLGVAAAVVAGFVINRFPSIVPLLVQLASAYVDDVKMRAARAAGHAGDDPAKPS